MRTKFLSTVIFILLGTTVFSQAQYEVSADPKHPEAKILKGIISKQLIKSDTSYKWYGENQKYYSNPDTSIVGAMQRNSNVKYIVFYAMNNIK